MLQRPGSAGLLSRAIALLLLEGVALTLVFVMHLLAIAFVDVPKTEIMLIFSAVTFAMLLGLVFSEIPGGDEYTFTRLGIATFCRTGLPLLVVMAVWKYSMCSLKLQPIFLVVVFYAVGHFGGMILSTLPLRSPPV